MLLICEDCIEAIVQVGFYNWYWEEEAKWLAADSDAEAIIERSEISIIAIASAIGTLADIISKLIETYQLGVLKKIWESV